MSWQDLGYIIVFISPFAVLGLISWLRFEHMKIAANESERPEFDDNPDVGKSRSGSL